MTATPGQPSYRAGQRPALTLHIANTGAVACTRDVSHQFRSVSVVPTGGSVPVWSSDDCYQRVTHEVHTLQPGQELTYRVVWAGRTAASGCPVGRVAVPPGVYALYGHLGSLTGPPTPITITN